MQEISYVDFVSGSPSHYELWSFLESIQHDFMKVLKDFDCQPNSELAQSL